MKIQNRVLNIQNNQQIKYLQKKGKKKKIEKEINQNTIPFNENVYIDLYHDVGLHSGHCLRLSDHDISCNNFSAT